jgi:hypothetical protein
MDLALTVDSCDDISISPNTARGVAGVDLGNQNSDIFIITLIPYGCCCGTVTVS